MDRSAGFLELPGSKFLKVITLRVGQLIVHLWELRYWFDSQLPFKTGGRMKLNVLASRREQRWYQIHQQMWPQHGSPPLVQSAGPGRPMRGPPELAGNQEFLAAPTSLFMAILLWSIIEDQRPAEYRFDAAGYFCEFANTFYLKIGQADNTRLPVFRVVRAGVLRSLQPTQLAFIDATAALDCATSECKAFREVWCEHLRSGGSPWLTHPPEMCTIGECLAMTLLAHRDTFPNVRALGIALATEFAAHIDAQIDTLVGRGAAAASSVPPLVAQGGRHRKIDPEIKAALSSRTSGQEDRSRCDSCWRLLRFINCCCFNPAPFDQRAVQCQFSVHSNSPGPHGNHPPHGRRAVGA